MIRVAAHKPGSISSIPQSDTLLTILTHGTQLLRECCILSKLFHWLTNWHLFTWLLLHSTTYHQNVHNRSIHSKPPLLFGRSKAVVFTCCYHTHVICWRGIWKAKRNPVRGENEVCVGFTRLSLGAGKWGDRGNVMWFPKSGPVSFGRYKGSAELVICLNVCCYMSPCFWINHRHVENVQIHILTICSTTCTVQYWLEV